jgi:protein O-mannosyl-transferase
MPEHKREKRLSLSPLPIRGLALAAVLLAVITVIAYHPVAGYGYISLDDPLYVSENPHVQAGLTWEGIRWAFTSFDASNWHPLTWLSLMLDVQLFGNQPGAFHTANLCLHIVTAILLLLFLARTTERLWLAAAVAGLFALHPLHVESVAWISERKDVLSGLFWMASMLAYAWYSGRPSWKRYAVVVIFFALGLMAKPMLVTLPLVLLLLDYWPLQRPGAHVSVVRLVLEKLPLLAVSAASCIVTVAAQRPATSSMQTIGLWDRLANAASSCVIYIRQMLWPTDLAILYPLASGPSGAAAISALVLIIAFTAAAVYWRRSRQYVLVGWLWYLVTLIPVVGLVQVGIQSHADRYTYIPLIGLFIIVVSAVGELVERRTLTRPAVITAAAVTFVLLAGVTWHQVSYWRNTMILYMRASASNDPASQPYLGVLFAPLDNRQMAAQLQEAISLHPGWARAHAHLGAVLAASGQIDAGMGECQKSLQLQPNLAVGHRTMGMLMAARGNYGGAAQEYSRSLSIEPDGTTWVNLADAQMRLGQPDKAEASLRSAIAMDPRIAISHTNLAVLLAQLGRRDEAIAELRTSLALNPGDTAARAFLDKLEASHR